MHHHKLVVTTDTDIHFNRVATKLEGCVYARQAVFGAQSPCATVAVDFRQIAIHRRIVPVGIGYRKQKWQPGAAIFRTS